MGAWYITDILKVFLYVICFNSSLNNSDRRLIIKVTCKAIFPFDFKHNFKNITDVYIIHPIFESYLKTGGYMNMPYF